MVIQQHSRKVLMMDILMSETCWAHKKWNKIASDFNFILQLWRDFWIRETETGQQVAQLHEKYTMMMMMMMMMINDFDSTITPNLSHD